MDKVPNVDSLITHLLKKEPKTREMTYGWLELQTTLLRDTLDTLEAAEGCESFMLPEDTSISGLQQDEKLTLHNKGKRFDRFRLREYIRFVSGLSSVI